MQTFIMSEFFDLSGRVAIVTGTSRGLGQYFGRALARAGADLVITSRDKTALTNFQHEIEQLGRRAVGLELDVRDYDSIQRMVSSAIDAYGKIDILVNTPAAMCASPHSMFPGTIGTSSSIPTFAGRSSPHRRSPGT